MESKKQNRPVFKEKTYIEIRVAGQRDVAACRPATHQDKQRFRAHFEAFEKRVEPPADGMPLAEWPQITRSQVEELSFLHVKTVEQLSGIKDANAARIMNGYKIREQAQKWLLVNDELKDDAEKAELKQDVEDLKQQIADLLAAKPAAKEVPVADSLASELDGEEEPEKPKSRRKTKAKPKTTLDE